MDREKLIDIITEANAFYVTDKEDIGIADRYEMSHKLADHLIANGIGDITAENDLIDFDRCSICNKPIPNVEKYGARFYKEKPICDNCCINIAQGEIEDEKHRADVAEEALKIACKEVATINYGTLAFKINIIDTIVQDVMKKCKQQAEERLLEAIIKNLF